MMPKILAYIPHTCEGVPGKSICRIEIDQSFPHSVGVGLLCSTLPFPSLLHVYGGDPAVEITTVVILLNPHALWGWP